MPGVGKILPENTKSEVQSVWFNMDDWTITEAKKWLKDNNFIRLGVEISGNFYKFRQFDPELFKRFVTKKLDGGIQLKIGFIKQEKLNKNVTDDICKNKVKLIKETASDEKRLVYGVVAEPELIDTDKEWTDENNIEKACHNFMKFFKESGIGHEFIVREGMDIVENYIAPSNLIINGILIKKGSWVMVHYISDDVIWEEIKSGELVGYSFEGVGILVDQTP